MPQWFMDDPFPFLIINHQQNRLVKDYYTHQVTGPIELHITISQKNIGQISLKCGDFTEYLAPLCLARFART